LYQVVGTHHLADNVGFLSHILLEFHAWKVGVGRRSETSEAAYALWFAYYNFCRVHKALRVAPAMESGIQNHVWTIGELID